MSHNPKPSRLTPCHRHPNLQTTTGLCTPCLHERLSLLNPSTSSSSQLPELRRCKTFSDKTFSAAIFEPRRRSCDVGGRNSLSSLFSIDNNDDDGYNKVESSNLGLTCPVPEVKEEEEEDDDDESVPEAKVEIARVSDFRNNEGEFDYKQGKTMKEFIDLELQANSTNNRKDFKEIASSLLGAATGFSKKLRKWRKKQEISIRNPGCNGNGVGDCNELRLQNLEGRRLSYTQSEFGRQSCDKDPRGSLDLGRASIDCGVFGRKSCDSDPRFSIDLGRASVDCGRVSVDESKSEFVDPPKAPWDGFLPRRGVTPVVSVIENAMATVYGFDDRVLGEGKVPMENRDAKDSSQRPRKGFDQCSSVKRDMVRMSDDGETIGLSNARISQGAIGIFNGTKLLITEKELNEWRLNSLKDDSLGSFETASKDLGSVSSSSIGKDEKKCHQWSVSSSSIGKDEKKCRQGSKLWSIWGLIHRSKGDKFGYQDDLPRNSNRGALVRSHRATSSCGSITTSDVRSGSGTTSKTESKAIVRGRQDDGILERNQSSRYPPNHIDNGMLRLYLTPLRSRRRNRLENSRLKKSQCLARSVLKLY